MFTIEEIAKAAREASFRLASVEERGKGSGFASHGRRSGGRGRHLKE